MGVVLTRSRDQRTLLGSTMLKAFLFFSS